MTDRSIPGLQFTGTVVADDLLIVLGTGHLADGRPVTVGIELNGVQRAQVRSRSQQLDDRLSGKSFNRGLVEKDSGDQR